MYELNFSPDREEKENKILDKIDFWEKERLINFVKITISNELINMNDRELEEMRL